MKWFLLDLLSDIWNLIQFLIVAAIMISPLVAVTLIEKWVDNSSCAQPCERDW
jgi:hypothetical protein